MVDQSTRASKLLAWFGVCALMSFMAAPLSHAQPGMLPPDARLQRPATPQTEPMLESKAVWQRWVADPRQNSLSIGEQSYRSMYDHLLWFLNKTKKDSLTFIDVGCAIGDYLAVVKERSTKPVHSIGIDPVDWPNRIPYETFLQVAIAKDAQEKVPFHLYGSSDLASSSLHRLKKENVTHDERERSERFYHPAPIEGEKGETVVQTIPLSQVFKKYVKADYVDLLKVDTQGTDLEVTLSAGPYLSRVLFLQIESILSNKPGHLLYDQQTTFEQDRAALEKRGFEVFNIAAFPAGPEGDVLFVNKKLFLEIARRDGIF
jgi:FkbM family methyltransferase